MGRAQHDVDATVTALDEAARDSGKPVLAARTGAEHLAPGAADTLRPARIPTYGRPGRRRSRRGRRRRASGSSSVARGCGGYGCRAAGWWTGSPRRGPILTLGAGGVLTEALDGATTRLLPVTEYDVRDALAQTRMARLLGGHRGQPPADLDAFVATVLTVAGLAARLPAGAALDLNPVVVRPDGAVVLDAALVAPEQE